MNKDTIVAIVIIFLSVLYFQGPFKNTALYEKLGGHPATAQTEMAATSAGTSQDMSRSAQVVTSDSSAKDSLVLDSLGNVVDTIAVAATQTAIQNDTIILENKLLTVKVSENGAQIISVQLKHYQYGKQHPLHGQPIELLADSTKGIGGTAIDGYDLRNVHFTYTDEKSNDTTAIFTGMLHGEEVIKEYRFTDSSYYFGLEVTSDLFSKKQSVPVTLYLDAGIDETEDAKGMSSRYSLRTVSLNDGKKLHKVMAKKVGTVSKAEGTAWNAISSKYFTLASINSQIMPTTVDISSWPVDPMVKINGNNLNSSIAINQKVSGTGTGWTLFAGPNERSALVMGGVGLEKTLFRGYTWFFFANVWFPMLCDVVLWFLNLFFMIFKDYGVAIILITFLLKLVTFPLSQSSMKSMGAMQELKPKMDKLQAKYKGDPQLLQQKTMELYKEEGVNPLASLGGCAPMLLQFPIMISLFLVLRKAIELRGETTFLVPWLTDLSQAERLFTLPFTIPLINTSAFAILPILSGVLMYFQNKATMKDPAQRQMMLMMPFVMAFMFYTMPSGLNLYFVVSSILQIAQQKWVDSQKKKKASQPLVMTKDGTVA